MRECYQVQQAGDRFNRTAAAHRILMDMRKIDMSAEIFGEWMALLVIVTAPMVGMDLMHAGGSEAIAKAAAARA